MEQSLRTTKLDPDPWDVGAVAAILPRLGDIKGVDWTKPVSAWSKDEIVGFILAALDLAREAMASRDDAEERTSPDVNHYDPNEGRGGDPHDPDDIFPDNLADEIGLLP